jgi:hypothetical protein
MYIDPKTKALNENVLNQIASQDQGLQKNAAAGLTDYLRVRAREDGYARNILPAVGVIPSDLDRQVSTIKPVIVRDMEPDTPPAYSVPFGVVPMNQYMDAPRYMVMFERILSRRFTADVANLLTYDMDIRQVFNDLMLKTMLAEEDRKFTGAVDVICGDIDDPNSQHAVDVASMGYVHVGAMSRISLKDSLKGLPSSNRNLNCSLALVNNVTILDIAGLDRAAIGGDLAQDIFVNGLTERTIMGTKYMVTIKKDLVANDDMYMFAAPKFLGDFFILEDVTVSTKTENYMFEMFAYENLGAIVKNAGAVAKVSFSGTFHGWTPSVYPEPTPTPTPTA